jgi:hypothetical protein
VRAALEQDYEAAGQLSGHWLYRPRAR